MTSTTTSPESRLGRKTKLTATIAAIAAFLVMVSGAPAMAAWAAVATATATVSTPAVSITQTGFDALGKTFLRNATDQTGGFTVTNSGNVEGSASLGLSVTGPAAAAIQVFVWSAPSVAACTAALMPGNAATGTWAAFPVLPAVTLAAGAAVTYCVRSVAANADALASTTGSQSMTVTATAQLTANGWSASTPASTTFSTQAFYPLATIPRVANQNNWFELRSVGSPGLCMDTFGTSTTPGTIVEVWTCTAQSNQRFEFYPTSDGRSGLRARVAAELSLGQTANKNVLAAPSADTEWRIEQVTPTSYQLVHGVTGLCVTAAGSGVQNPLTACTGGASQQFTLTRDPLTCSASGAQLTLNFSSKPMSRLYTVQNRVGGGAWTNAYLTSSSGAASFDLTRSMFLTGDATLDVRVVDSVGNVLYSGLTLTTTGTTIACGAGFV